ncbi:MAG: YibE/F family protein [Actinomycetota bacterium]
MTHPDDADWAAFAPDPNEPTTWRWGVPESLAAGIALLVAVGIFLFWPSSLSVEQAINQISVLGIPRQFHEAVATEVTDFSCLGAIDDSCALVIFEITSGPDAGLPYAQEFTAGSVTPIVEVGDRVILSYLPPNGEITDLVAQPCTYDPDATCAVASVFVASGNGSGSTETVELFSGQEVDLAVGDHVHTTFDSDGVAVAVTPASLRTSYQFADFQRRSFLYVLVLLFAAGVIALGRWRGVAALVGLGLTLVVVLYWLIPSLLSGHRPGPVALVGASAVAYVALYVSHGLSRTTTIALLGTVGALTLTTLLSALSVRIAQFTGFASEESMLLVLLDGIDVQGLLLAGIVIGAAGALDDITVTQSSAIAQLRSAAPDISTHELLGRGMAIGRAHVGSIVNTLVLAYLGAALPLTILFVLAQQSLGTVLNSEVVAVEVTRTLVGTLGIVAAVPLTTWLATLWPSLPIHEH